jgi:hypothetical protein
LKNDIEETCSCDSLRIEPEIACSELTNFLDAELCSSSVSFSSASKVHSGEEETAE